MVGPIQNSGFNALPQEVAERIVKQATNIKIETYTVSKIKELAKQIQNISETNRANSELLSPKLNDLKEIVRLIKKYKYYQDDYEYLSRTERGTTNVKIGGPPQLLDALFAGCELPFANSSAQEFNDNLREDINQILKLMPESIHCKFGQLRCRYEVTPLYAACINPNIPLDIVELLLQKGADPNEKILLNGGPINSLVDLKNNLEDSSPERYNKIKELFIKYGYIQPTIRA